MMNPHPLPVGPSVISDRKASHPCNLFLFPILQRQVRAVVGYLHCGLNLSSAHLIRYPNNRSGLYL